MTITLNVTKQLGDEALQHLMRKYDITATQAVTALLNHGLTVVRDMDQDFDKLCTRLEGEQK